MSLLMDALKKAEQANKQGQGDQDGQGEPSSPGASDLSLEPIAPGETKPEALAPASSQTPDIKPTLLPELPKLEDLDQEFIAHARQSAPKGPAAAATQKRPPASSQPPATAPATSDAVAREAVRNAFAVKQPPAVNRMPMLVAGALGSLAAVAIGAYVWLQIEPRPGLATPGLQAAPRPPMTAAVATPPVPSRPTEATAVAASGPAAESAPRPRTEPRPLPPQQPIATPTAADTIHFATSRSEAAPAAADGYAALQAGNVGAARIAYDRLLQADPRNIDAWNGLAAIALKEGRIDDAEAAYLRALAIDPRDATANAAMIGLRSQNDPVAGESRIKTLLAQQPDLPVLNFALGNMYARQNRWSEAQQVYFKAFSGDADNPDYLFNLAVALDQLNQPGLAAQYYRQALTAAESRPAAFDRVQVAGRLHELQP